ncbi:hypothetical protein GUJ93_ZPchr0008g13679 [Zizania palustris]|uniref:Uncharacterized protein n=1 Tax=Zizania palustris TaxID=103762 RepID=A0A8J5V4Z0_ZIZPA|nr:hypothetical protein GUJ93_ZPchr0008g13679 [Zizania palustris]
MGFTAGGFIYIAVAGVLPDMNDQKTTIKSSMIQLFSLTTGMLVALGFRKARLVAMNGEKWCWSSFLTSRSPSGKEDSMVVAVLWIQNSNKHKCQGNDETRP